MHMLTVTTKNLLRVSFFLRCYFILFVTFFKKPSCFDIMLNILYPFFPKYR